MAGPIARLLGARRVVGSTSSHDKARRVVAELGYDAAVARAAGPFAEQLRAAAPDGVDVVIDLVGGDQLQAALSLARDGARVALVGTLNMDLAHGDASHSSVALDPYRFLARRVTMRGYSADDDVTAMPEWQQRASAWQATGQLRFAHVVVDGLEHAAQALVDASAGRYLGAVIVNI